MRVIRRVAGQWVVILIDSGSTHNFLDSGVAKKAKLPICAEKGDHVANGDHVVCERWGKIEKVLVHGHFFHI